MARPVVELERKAGIVAMMLSRGYTRDEIRTKIGNDSDGKPISAGYLSKIIRYATDNNILSIEYKFHAHNLSVDFHEELNLFENVAAKINRNFPNLHTLHICNTHGSEKHASSNPELNSDWSLFAEALLKKLHTPSYVGVSRGSTLYNIARTLRQNTESKSIAGINWSETEFFPVTAEFGRNPNALLNSSNIAFTMSDALSSIDPHEVPTLRNMESLMHVDRQGLHQFRESNKTYRDIFGKPKPYDINTSNITSSRRRWKDSLSGQMDTLLTSVSAANRAIGRDLQPCLRSLARYLKTHGFDNDAKMLDTNLGDQIIGDIAGSLVIRKPKNLSDAEANWLMEYNYRVNSINFNHLKFLSSRARKKSDDINGVVVIARGVEKAPVVKCLLEQGLINRLFCDEGLAEAL